MCCGVPPVGGDDVQLTRCGTPDVRQHTRFGHCSLPSSSAAKMHKRQLAGLWQVGMLVAPALQATARSSQAVALCRTRLPMQSCSCWYKQNLNAVDRITTASCSNQPSRKRQESSRQSRRIQTAQSGKRRCFMRQDALQTAPVSRSCSEQWGLLCLQSRFPSQSAAPDLQCSRHRCHRHALPQPAARRRCGVLVAVLV